MATAIRPQILLMDEWFLAGDANFMDKARARLEALVQTAEILVLSSHRVRSCGNGHPGDLARPWPHPG